ncbi:regulator of chromosome condensation 1/beta-lactamase-inhibitor protein II [Glomus cerebriforme]|uniref:Regulator of chromosome condensation 1/beta-lactamase-inhibitor protein II n=1 Tax=Glomus cerebriforme TaxID=658196 RepID=A0A397SMK9_9GLOM|nr:regulator of chromosome condensation 1/beta-lactamase-inhibitor protein II [Glomus cerebriforme]
MSQCGEENKPAYAEGLDNVNIVKVACGDNITFAISDQGHLYATVAGANHALVLTREGEVYAWGSNEVCSLGYNECELLVPFNMGLKHIVKLYVSAYHNFAIDDNGNVWALGLNNMGVMGQCGFDELKLTITSPEMNSFLKKVGQKVEKFAARTGDHFLMVVNIFNNIYAWGFGEFSVLKNNKDEDETLPFQIPDLNGLKEKDIVRISCGSSHALFLGV